MVSYYILLHLKTHKVMKTFLGESLLSVVFVFFVFYTMFGGCPYLRIFSGFCLLYYTFWLLVFTILTSREMMIPFLRKFLEEKTFPTNKVITDFICVKNSTTSTLSSNTGSVIFGTTGICYLDSDLGVTTERELQGSIKKEDLDHALAISNDEYVDSLECTRKLDAAQAALIRIRTGESPMVPESLPSWNNSPESLVTGTPRYSGETQMERHLNDVHNAENVLAQARERVRYNEKVRALEREREEHWQHERDLHQQQLTRDVLKTAKETESLKIKEREFTQTTQLITRAIQETLGNFAMVTPRFLEKLGKLTARYIL